MMSKHNMKQSKSNRHINNKSIYYQCFLFFFVFFIGYIAYPVNHLLLDNYNAYIRIQNETTKAEVKPKIKYIDVSYYPLDIDMLENKIRHFIIGYFGNDDSRYVNTVTAAYMRLLREEKENKHNVLYYIALCSVESNFRMSARSGAGAVGISQIMPSIWADVVKKNYGITKEELYIDPYKNIYAGYRVWDNYRRKGNGTIKSANSGYLGANSEAYSSRINDRYVRLVGLIFDEVFCSDIIETKKKLIIN